MFCCIGLLGGFLLGEYLGVGPLLGPVGFVLGLIADKKVFGLIRRPSPLKEYIEDRSAHTTVIPACCAPTPSQESSEQARLPIQKRKRTDYLSNKT